MTRYTINIGNDFPLGDDNEPGRDDGRWNRPRRGFRSGTLLRGLFMLAIAAIVITHPIKTALLVGIVLLVRRSPMFDEYRQRWRALARRNWPEVAHKIEAWRAHRWTRADRVHEPANDSEPDSGERADRGYRGFV